MGKCIFVFKLPGERNENKMRLRIEGGVEESRYLVLPLQFKNSALIRLRDCALILEFKISEIERFYFMTKSGM